MDILPDIIKGALFGTLIVLCIAIPRHILWCRRQDRSAALCLRMKEADRESELRAAGLSEEDIICLRATLKAKRKEVGCWDKWDEEFSGLWN